jgi:hypothetical protein
MTGTDETNNDASQTDSTEGGVGDLETAGETTAAEMIGGAPDTRPVGEDTLANVKISETSEMTASDED